MNRVSSRPEQRFRHPLLLGLRDHLLTFALIFTFLFITHAPLLRLPYFWDEAGYFIPAARDLLLTGSLVPHTTLSNAHPPLVMLWLAFWWKFSAFTPAVTRIAMLLVSAFALLGLWRLGRDVANEEVAAATVLCTALYPVFFAQSSLAHLDMMAGALTLWGLAMYLERRLAATIVFFALAPLAKETAVIAPLALLGWELLGLVTVRTPLFASRFSLFAREPRMQPGKAKRQTEVNLGSPPLWRTAKSEQRRAKSVSADLRQACSLLLCLLPLALWFSYHHHRTGFYFGNPEYLRYNLQATFNPLRILFAIGIRLWHILGYLNLFALTLAALYGMSRPAVRERDGTVRARIPVNVQLVFAVVILAYVVALSVAGGAMLARYMLPVLPLVVLICVSTIRRRFRYWLWWIGAACVAFVFALLAPPPYRVSPEDTLLYRDYVILHKLAADEIAARYPHARILTAWPASDELTRPFLGYVKQPLSVVRIENFSPPQIERASQAADQFDVALLFTTKWEPPNPLLQNLLFGRQIQERFFDYHEDLPPQAAADMLGGRVVRYLNRNNEWVAIIAIEKIQNAAF
jgi:Dolichyl-phosphate-mannose-protein mannosyltransferase